MSKTTARKSTTSASSGTGFMVALIVLVVMVVGLVAVSVSIDRVSNTLDLTPTPTLAAGEAVPETEPVQLVNVSGIAVLGGVMLLLVLGVVIMEFRRSL